EGDRVPKLMAGVDPEARLVTSGFSSPLYASATRSEHTLPGHRSAALQPSTSRRSVPAHHDARQRSARLFWGVFAATLFAAGTPLREGTSFGAACAWERSAALS